MYTESQEINWIHRLIDWATQCEQSIEALQTRTDMATDVQEEVDAWLGRFSELRHAAEQYYRQSTDDEQSDDSANNKVDELNTKAHELKGQFTQFITEASTHHMQPGSEDNPSHQQADDSPDWDGSDSPDDWDDGDSPDRDQSDSPDWNDDDRQSGAQTVPIGQHTLPPLPYNYNALEPHISEDIMRLHHDEHHKSYVEGLNKAEEEMQKARQSGDFSLIRHWEGEAAFNGAGHYLHTIFWHNMSPNGGGKPSGPISKEIKRTFGSFEKFKQHFTNAADKVQGVGWAMLVWSPRSRRTEILQAEKHQNLSQQDIIPLLVLDVWEHAYYLQYANKRSDYIDAWWHVVNWDDVNHRFEEAKKVQWQPY